MHDDTSRFTADTLLSTLAAMHAAGQAQVSSSQLAEATGASLAAVKRALSGLLDSRRIEVSGKARATRYRLPCYRAPAVFAPRPVQGFSVKEPDREPSATRLGPHWSAASLALREYLALPLAARAPVAYRRAFVDGYKPNQTFLLPAARADELAALGRMPGQMPAGTYIRKVLEQLLIDLSWSSSHLEGNRYTLLDTEELFKSGAAATDLDAVMLLNHKAAIEFLVDAVPTQGLVSGLVRNLHAVLMQDLLADVASLGTIREKVVNISGSTYLPTQVPAVLQEMFERIVATAQDIKNPLEAAFFLWVQLAYLQPFEDGNKRVSRLAANIPLMLYNHAPLSFLDVDREDYALAMMGVYECGDVSMAVDLFDWTYRRSHAKYKVVLEAAGAPDAFRIRHREALNEAVGAVVRGRQTQPVAIDRLGLPPDDGVKLLQILGQELNALAPFNCARYRLGMAETQAWIDAGRPK